MMLADVMLICSARSNSRRPRYFVPPDFAFATLGEGDAAAGDAEGLAAGLAVLAGVVVAGTAGEAVVVAGAFELFSVSAQPAAKAIETVARRSRAVRLMKLMCADFICLSSVRARLKSRMMIAPMAIRSNGCSHSSSRKKASLSKHTP